ncbi:MAG TPA: Sec-independent protein translocase protein TatB [Burkholderiales bacterium]|nr:Sec-independent protein translocase protein TatB [Burkholderiales bacterium]
MFDIGFSELLIIAVVALIVIGPERLPKVARTMGHLFGRLQRYVSQVKSDINREMELDELRKLQGSVQEAARSLEQGFQSEVRQAEEGLRSVEQGLNEAASPGTQLPAPPPVSEPPAAPAPPAPDRPA